MVAKLPFTIESSIYILHQKQVIGTQKPNGLPFWDTCNS